jgi:hypothetical protein
VHVAQIGCIPSSEVAQKHAVWLAMKRGAKFEAVGKLPEAQRWHAQHVTTQA